MLGSGYWGISCDGILGHWVGDDSCALRFTLLDYAVLVDPPFACGGRRVGNS